MLEIFICDDLPQWTKVLEEKIENILKISYNLSSFNNSKDLLDAMSKQKVDILITDIQMPNMNGIELAKEIYKLDRHTQIIFTSAYKDYIEDVFAINPVFYLLKPIKDEKLEEAFLKAIKNLDDNNQVISIISKGKSVQIQISNILYTESNKRNVTFHSKNREISCISKLDDIEEKLPTYFVRCHKSYLVNIKEIKRISNNEIELRSGQVIPVAKSRFSKTKNIVLNFWEAQL